jgi:FAD/FMN-containing dehydrogenase
MLFPLDIGGRGSCQIGGNVSTNAGGNRVLRYGMMRELVLGLEVVLADGTVLSTLNKMLGTNAGYDLKQLFIGSEGALVVVTRAVLRLFPRPDSVCTALCALRGYEQVLELLRRARPPRGSAGRLRDDVAGLPPSRDRGAGAPRARAAGPRRLRAAGVDGH